MRIAYNIDGCSSVGNWFSNCEVNRELLKRTVARLNKQWGIGTHWIVYN